MYPQISTWFWCPAFAFALSLGLSWRVKQPTAAWFHLIVAKNGIPISWWRPQDVYRNELTNWRNKWINLYIYHTYIIHILYIYIYTYGDIRGSISNFIPGRTIPRFPTSSLSRRQRRAPLPLPLLKPGMLVLFWVTCCRHKPQKERSEVKEGL